MKRSRHKSKGKQNHRRSMLSIGAVLVLLVVVAMIGSVSLQAKNKEYMAQEEELNTQIEEEKARAEEIEELEEHMGTQEYIEQIAKDKLGLIYEDEILFRIK